MNSRPSSTATRLDTQTSDDVNITGGKIGGVVLEAISVSIGDYTLFQDIDGSLKIRVPDGSITVLVLHS